MYQSSLLLPAECSDYETLTFPAYRQGLAESGTGAASFALGVRDGDAQPVALGLAAFVADGVVRVLSLYVRPEHRERGLGTRLLAWKRRHGAGAHSG